MATIMRRVGASGVQTHASMFENYLRHRSSPVSTITPFDSGSVLMRPVFAARYGIAPFSGSGGVWWYRHWHDYYLRVALRQRLESARHRQVIYAQCPVSADAALHVRTTQPVVMVVHFNISQADEWAHDKGQIRDGGRLFRSIRALEDRVLPRLDGIVYVSEFMRDVLETRMPALTGVRSAVIPNFIEMRDVVAEPAQRDLITVGALEPRKNHAYLLEIVAAAAARGHRYTLTVVGTGPDKAALANRAEALGIADLVQFVGYHPDPRELMAGHRVYCHTSRMESFGIVLIEAMSMGLPVLACPAGAVPEIVRSDVDGCLWPPDDPRAAADALIQVLEKPGSVHRMGLAARERVENHFSDTVAASRLEGFLLESTKLASSA
jgi:glycosyltransferase involved in cell wall biosynthesis